MLKAILYFDVFSYPLTKDELYANSATTLSETEFIQQLVELMDRGYIKSSGDYVLSAAASLDCIDRRIRGNEGAKRIMPEAYRYSRKIAAFPFVEGVCLSGGLSKNYYDREGDIDYLIMTRSNRLWICRTLLIIRFKLLPGTRKKFWCINYFLGAEDLQIPEQNIFVATELAFLIPTVNYGFYKQIADRNLWYKNYYPHKQPASSVRCTHAPRPLTKRITEALFSGVVGNWLDNKLLSYTLNRWRKKYPGMKEEDFELQFRSRKNVCKRHTHGFQNKVLKNWNEKINAFESQFHIRLTE